MSKEKEELFIPFQHKQLELKNLLINHARELSKNGDFASRLTAAFIYISFTEYLSEHLTRTLNYFIKNGSFNYFGGITYYNPKETHKDKLLTLGKRIQILDNYEFPGKADIIQLFWKIDKPRNTIFHNFAKVEEGDLDVAQVNQNIDAIFQCSEELLDRINTVYAGLEKVLLPKEEPKEKDMDTQNE